MIFWKKIGILLTLASLTACRHGHTGPKVVVGTISGPETGLMETAAQLAKKEAGITIKVVAFTDYMTPNAALAEGSLSADMFQHKPFLDYFTQLKHYPLVSVGRTFVYPMGLYSSTVKDLKALPEHGIVAIPSDPTNMARALLLMEEANLLRLRHREGTSTILTIRDIVHNPLQLKIRELEAGSLPRILRDVDLAAINTNYAVAAGLQPSKQALFLEKKDSRYANILVVRKKDLHQPWVRILVCAIQSKPVIEEAKRLFKGEAIVAWDPAAHEKECNPKLLQQAIERAKLKANKTT